MSLIYNATIAQSLAEAVDEGVEHGEASVIQKAVTLSTHEDSFASQVLVNPDLFRGTSVKEGSILQFHDLPASKHGEVSLSESRDELASVPWDVQSGNAFVFIVKYPRSDMISKMQNMQISIPKSLSEGLKVQKNVSVILSGTSRDRIQASHVELFFRDQYLTRADMWRLANSCLVGQCIYKGQKVNFMNNITVEVKRIHCNGHLVKSALFTPTTKPIFRSRSARYVLFVQMSKEMWEFDAEGSGEIMFDKVVNGFLPQLFARWKETQVRHLVSIVFFTRMEYDSTSALSSGTTKAENESVGVTTNIDSKDFYRVVVSDTASVESADIMERLKREFQVFLRDVSLRKPEIGQYTALGAGLSAASADMPYKVILGSPSPASRGNVLEAINLASSQFSSDYIDRDLVRTGVSVVLISPGTGVFDVDYSTLIATTENLTENGVGIDLVCLSEMPLHSVPLFRYKQPIEEIDPRLNVSSSENSNTPASRSSNVMRYGTPTSFTKNSPTTSAQKQQTKDEWSYGIPHWVDISYWSKVERNLALKPRHKIPVKSNNNSQTAGSKPFVSRVRMYELQMMGVMGEAVQDITIPLLTPISNTENEGVLSRQLENPASSIHYQNSSDTAITGFSGPRRSSLNTLNHLATSQSDSPKMSPHAVATSHWMARYDEEVFRSSKRINKSFKAAKAQSGSLKKGKSPVAVPDKSLLKDNKSPLVMSGKNNTSQNGPETGSRLPLSHHEPSRPSLVSAMYKASRRPTSTTRKISFGPRGLGVATPTAAAAIATIDTFDTQFDLRIGKTHPKIMNDDASSGQDSTAMQNITGQARDMQGKDPPFEDDAKSAEALDNGSDFETSRPIPIRKGVTLDNTDDLETTESEEKDVADYKDRVTTLKDLTKKRYLAQSKVAAVTYGPELPTISPSTTLAPWLTVLNPCNPSKYLMSFTSRLGRWQHLFPRTPKASSIKWLSLCSPAAIPLTTEDFPTPDGLSGDYRERSYTVHLPEETDLGPQPRSLANELIAFRLARGFQIVVGKEVATYSQQDLFKNQGVFDEHMLVRENSQLWLLRGGTIHRLKRTANDRLEVTTFTRHATLRPPGLEDDSFVQYTPLIRSMLAETYEPHSISTMPQRDPFNWESIDSFIAGHEHPQAEHYIETLRPWRARFVLIPTYSPADSRRTSRDRDLTEEESRLEGIKRLTHLWQKARYVPLEDRRFTKTKRLKEDANPLDVQFYTKHPSEVVSEELSHANISSSYKTAGVQLLPEADLLQRSSLNTKAVAEKLQSDKGVRIVDRRWHWKLHHYCFIGSELTTWILENFKDIYARQEAVELGNELMQDGLFRHVERRHDFLDGHYFYQIADDYRGPRAESRGFFGWGKASVPATPLKETHPAESPSTTTQPRADNSPGVDFEHSPEAGAARQRLNVALGKSLIFNLVHNRSKVSYREELMNVHYDRLHNPDSCYHICLEWMNATPKLVQNAINHWASMVEPHGLRLVEVPIGEASAIRSNHPFRSPYTIKLVRDLKLSQPLSQYTSRSFGRGPCNFLFQEAILRRFGYVLDFEAASAFPHDVDVTYSWGKPDYRYAQYIHRSGLLIAQITDRSEILVLANRLYNNKSSSARAKPVEVEDLQERSAFIPRVIPLRPGDGLTQRYSPRSSPSPSPALKATLDIPGTTTPVQRSPLSQISSAHQTHHPSIGSSEQTVDAERMTRDLQTFCEDEAALDAFFSEQMNRLTSSTPQTPLMSSKQTPSRIPERIGEESGIPDLTLPSSLTDRQGQFNEGFEWKQEDQRKRRQSESPTTKALKKKLIAGERSPLSKPE